MALKKTIINANGVSCSYHKIKDLVVSSAKDGNVTITAKLCSYVDEEIRKKSEGLHVDNKEFRLTIPLSDVETQSVFAIAYAKIKETKAFKGAEDC